MQTILEWLSTPKAAVRNLGAVSLGLALWVMVGSAASLSAIDALSVSDFFFSVLLYWVFQVLLSAGGAIVLDFSAQIQGGEPASGKLFRGILMAHLPLLFWVPAGIILNPLHPNIAALAHTVLVGWSLLMQVWVIQGVYGMSLVRSLSVYALPFVAFMAAIGTILVAGVWVGITA